MAYADGATRAQVRHRLATGEWRRVAGDGLCLGDDPPHALAPLVAATATWPDAVLIRESAALVHRLQVEVAPLPVHVWVPRARRPRDGITPHRYRLAPDDVVRSPYGLVTTWSRTVHDVHAHLPGRDADAFVALSVVRGDVTSDSLETHRRARPGCWGNAQLARLADDTRDGAVSTPEREVIAMLRGARIGGWSANVRVADAQGVIGVVDLLFERERIAIEVDGYAHHGMAQFERDRSKQNRLILAGYTVLRFTATQVRDEPARVLTEIGRALAHARAGRDPR